MKKILSNKYLKFSLLILVGIFIGWILFHRAPESTTKHDHTPQVEKKQEIWTCSMHPQIRMDKPGKCPICGMDLILLNQNAGNEDPDAIHLTADAAALADIETSVVTKQKPVKQVRLYGKVVADERMVQSITAHVPGRIEKLLVNFTGEGIRNGQILATIYSPELVTAQQELLETAKSKMQQPAIYEAAKEKLKLWKLTNNQIEQIEKDGKVETSFNVISANNGIVINRLVNNGDYVKQGSPLYEITDLSKLWVVFDAYESDLPFLNTGETLNFTVEAVPGKKFQGKIAFIDPVIDPVTRVTKVRVEITNPGGLLKPEMFVTGMADAKLTQYANNIVIPKSAVLWTGKRSIVYVKISEGKDIAFKMLEIVLGPAVGDSYVVTGGIKEGEEVVTNGTFSVDAAAQLEGKPSMMNSSNKMEMPPAKVHSQSMDKKMTSSLEHAQFKVFGNCEMCKDRIEEAAKSLPGIKSAVWDIDTKQIHVEFDKTKTTIGKLHKTIAKAGHDTELEKAPDDVYNKLPECCLYRQHK